MNDKAARRIEGTFWQLVEEAGGLELFIKSGALHSALWNERDGQLTVFFTSEPHQPLSAILRGDDARRVYRMLRRSTEVTVDAEIKS